MTDDERTAPSHEQPGADSGVALLPCPFCGRKPHHGLSKVRYCQLHGDPIQDYRVWCPMGSGVPFDGSHARVDACDQQTAFSLWNQRPGVGALPQPAVRRLSLYERSLRADGT